MYQKIHEDIAVVGVYNQAQFSPRKFFWQNKIHTIDKITLISDLKDGGVQKRQYAVVVGPNIYRLVFNRQDETWQVAEVWCE